MWGENIMPNLNRRNMLKAGLAGAAATAVASPAIAQGNPEVKWRMPMFIPKSVLTLWNEGNDFCKRVAEATEGRFQIQPFAVGEIVPGGPAIMDAVQTGTVECGFTLSYYSFGKDPTYAFGTTLPFGFNTRMQMSWMLRGSGKQAYGDFMKANGCIAIPIGNSGAQMGGWFRKEINTLADLKGVKMRIPGLGGAVISKLGVVPQQIAAGEIYPALERGTIDAAEWAAPIDDEGFGFYRVAPYYYAPGWWEPNAAITLNINLAQWEKLPKHYQRIIEDAALATHQNIVAQYDVSNSLALRRLVSKGAQVRYFSTEILDAAYKASFETFDEISKTNAAFAKVYAAWKQHLDDNELYLRIGENSFESYTWAKRVLK
jgi:TRAP-type mannitol/chloroaromatic compound transport system substrate-binding protein